MEEFHRIRRLPPYVFEQGNRAKWPARSSLTASVAIAREGAPAGGSSACPRGTQDAGRPPPAASHTSPRSSAARASPNISMRSSSDMENRIKECPSSIFLPTAPLALGRHAGKARQAMDARNAGAGTAGRAAAAASGQFARRRRRGCVRASHERDRQYHRSGRHCRHSAVAPAPLPVL
jgi:hypothetical protein